MMNNINRKWNTVNSKAEIFLIDWNTFENDFG